MYWMVTGKENINTKKISVLLEYEPSKYSIEGEHVSYIIALIKKGERDKYY